MSAALQQQHPHFFGNWEDLEHFLQLAHSPIRSQQREVALEKWEQYKLSRQLAWLREQEGSLLTKGGYIRALTAPVIDLRGASLDEICVGFVDLRGALLDQASLRGAWLKGAKLEHASLRKTDFSPSTLHGFSRNSRLLGADLRFADLQGAKLAEADLSDAALQDANLGNADLRNSNLQRAILVHTNLQGCNLSGSTVYGISTWDVQIDSNPLHQHDLIITPPEQSPVVIDNLEVAQFTYFLLQNRNIRKVIDTIGKKGVLILGRFTQERKAILDAVRQVLREHGFVPMLFDFERPDDRDFTETIVTLAGLSRFVIADITNPKSAPLELKATIPTFQIPFVPIIAAEEEPFSMFADLLAMHGEQHGGHVMTIRKYTSQDALIRNLWPHIIQPALALSEQLSERKGRTIDTIVLA